MDLCQNCLDALPRTQHACPVCGLALSSETTAPCGRCQKRPPPYRQLHALFAYQDEVRYLVQSLKYQQKMAHGRLLGQLMLREIARDACAIQALIPVPLHPRRSHQRGFNQSDLIARQLGRILHIPIDPMRCKRVRDTPSQASLNAHQRRQNVKHAFSCQPTDKLQRVVIIDDVVTTGATVEELAKTLRRAGVGEVDVWCCARA